MNPRNKIRWNAVLFLLMAACAKPEVATIRFPGSARPGGIMACGGAREDQEVRVVSFFVTWPCATKPPLEVRVTNDVGVRVYDEKLPIVLIAGREERVSVRVPLPRQSMVVTIEVEASCDQNSGGALVVETKSCLVE